MISCVSWLKENVMKSIVSVLIIAFGCVIAHAQDVKLSIEMSSDTLLIGNYFELKYEIENASASEFEAPNLNGIGIVNGPNTSTRMSFVNGKMSQSASFTYYIEPQEIGSFTIPPAFLVLEDNTMETPPIDIIVLPNPDGIIEKSFRSSVRIDQTQTEPKVDEKPKRQIKKF